ncbi:cation:proton antiporter [Metabacillus indicus]|uniref:cation:proton antiporter n=1 Tax=Metabacillus indicus TaxID=246786 RepID=UPI0024916DB7|nr:cation:proton antiporter [Metabacillus indicus]
MNLPLSIGIILFILFAAAYFGIKVLKIPDVVIYILFGAGIALSGYIEDTKIIAVAGEIGLILMFFLLGMKFSLKEISAKGKKVWKPGVLDLVLGVGVTFCICFLAGQDLFTSFLIGTLVYATSSSITVKLLEHKNRLEHKESGYILSLLIFEDLAAPILISILISLNSDGFTFTEFAMIFLKAGLLLGAALLTGKLLFGKAHDLIDKFTHQDYFVIFVLGIALLFGGLALYLELSEVIGAFLAGLMLSDTEFKGKVKEVVMPVRNLLLPFFFLNFGLSLEFTADIPALGLLAIIIIWSVLHKLIVGLAGGKLYGLNAEQSFQAGLSLTARGEFSVIVAGIAAGGLKVFSGIYILSAALIGMVLFTLSPHVSKLILKKKKQAT